MRYSLNKSLLSLFLVFIFVSCSTLPSTPTQELQPTEAIIRSQAGQDAWSEDLDFFLSRVEATHPDAYYRVSKDEYIGAIEDIKENLPILTDEQIIVELARIVAFIDGHSTMDIFGEPVNFRHYPLRLYVFSDGIFVLDAMEPFRNLIRGKVVEIGNNPVDDVLDLVTPLVPHDNPMTIEHRVSSWLMRPEVLAALGIIDSVESPQIVIELEDGTMQTVNPEPVTWGEYLEWAGRANYGSGPIFGLPQNPDVLYLSHAFSDDFWFTYLEDSGTLYIQYNRVAGGIEPLVADIRDFLDGQEVERVVLDIRLNPGGNNTTYRNFLNFLSTDERINRPGHFFTIIGRQTFSAATNFVTELENQTHTIFVGEPTGGSPNLFGDVVPFTLPNSKISINVSARYWEKSTPEDKRVWIEPDISAPLSSDDYFNGQDPAMNMILGFGSQDGFTPGYNPILEPGDESAWDAADVRDPFVVELDGRYYMFYAGQDANGVSSIGYATSQNGRKWFRVDKNPVLTGSGEGFDSYGVTAPVIHKEGDVWVMYYAAIESSRGRPTAIGRATAQDLRGPWERSQEPVLTVSNSPTWDSLSITPGSVVDVDGKMRLYYSGFSETQKIGIGFAESADGITWTKHGDPVLPGGSRGDWDEIVYAPFVQLRDGNWEMFYHGDPFSSRDANDIGLGLAASSDDITWTRPDAPFLVSDDEERFPHTPFVLDVGDFLYVYYASVLKDGSAGQIQMKVLPK